MVFYYLFVLLSINVYKCIQFVHNNTVPLWYVTKGITNMKRKIGTILLLPFLLTACDKEMTREELEDIKGHSVSDRFFELFDKISGISNSEFPLVDFLNDIEHLESVNEKTLNTCKMYDDIEKIYKVFVELEGRVDELHSVNRTLNNAIDELTSYDEEYFEYCGHHNEFYGGYCEDEYGNIYYDEYAIPDEVNEMRREYEDR